MSNTVKGLIVIGAAFGAGFYCGKRAAAKLR